MTEKQTRELLQKALKALEEAKPFVPLEAPAKAAVKAAIADLKSALSP